MTAVPVIVKFLIVVSTLFKFLSVPVPIQIGVKLEIKNDTMTFMHKDFIISNKLFNRIDTTPKDAFILELKSSINASISLFIILIP